MAVYDWLWGYGSVQLANGIWQYTIGYWVNIGVRSRISNRNLRTSQTSVELDLSNNYLDMFQELKYRVIQGVEASVVSSAGASG